MRFVGPISEDEMIAAFLGAELDSSRYGKQLRSMLERDERDVDVLRRHDLADDSANRYRRLLLDEYRGYERREGLFLGFPRRVDWHRAVLGRDELLDILFIDWDWWLEISGGTRRPHDAARRIRDGVVPGVTAEEHEPLAAAAADGAAPELIAVTNAAYSPIVLLEGHFRLTAYALHPERLPEQLELLLGVSDEISSWSQF